MTAQSAGLKLPELPLHFTLYERYARGEKLRPVYTADQMREYGRQCALAAPAADGWRPIAEAPKDSEVVLLCDTHGNRWSDCFPGVPANGCGYPAILWQPLPAAPQAQGGG